LTPESVLAHCVQRLPDFMVPRYLEIRDDLPRTPTGRIEKYRLREEPLADDCYDRGDDRPARR
jgi:crotonobetaine/carnitine-CoA ligase